MPFDDVFLVSKKVTPATREEIDRLKRFIGDDGLPPAYIEFITTFGKGAYAQLYVIYTPLRILREYGEWRDMCGAGWDYKSPGILTQQQAEESVILGRTFNGDDLVYYPGKPDTLLILRHEGVRVVRRAADFSDLHLWSVAKGKIFEPVRDCQELRTVISTPMEMSNLAQRFVERWSHAPHQIERRRNEVERYTTIYLQAIGGTVTLRAQKGAKAIEIRIDHDDEWNAEVDEFVATLHPQGSEPPTSQRRRIQAQG